MPQRPVCALEPLEYRNLLSTAFVWDGGGTDALWSTAANWVGDVAPTAATADPSGVVIQFTGGVQSQMDVSGLAIDQLELLGNDNRVEIASSTVLRLNGGVLTENVISSGTGNMLVNQDLSIDSTSQLDLTGSAPVLRVDGGAELTVRAHITGTVGLTKTGAGRLDLHNKVISYSFSGPVRLLDGTTYLGAQNSNSIGGYVYGTTVRDSLTVGAGARVVVQGMNQFGEDPSVPAYNGRTVRQGTATVALGAGATLELGNQLVAVKSLAGDAGSVVVLGGVSDFYVGSPYDPATDTEFAGALTGTGQVLYANLGTWALSGASTFDGSVYVNAGALRAGAAGALSPNAQVFLFDTTLDLNDFDQTVRSVADERAPGALTSTAQVRLGAARLTIRACYEPSCAP